MSDNKRVLGVNLTIQEGDEFRRLIKDALDDEGSCSDIRPSGENRIGGCMHNCGSRPDEIARKILAHFGITEDEPYGVCDNCNKAVATAEDLFDSAAFVGYERLECKSCHESRAETYKEKQDWLALSDEERGRIERERPIANERMFDSMRSMFMDAATGKRTLP